MPESVAADIAAAAAKQVLVWLGGGIVALVAWAIRAHIHLERLRSDVAVLTGRLSALDDCARAASVEAAHATLRAERREALGRVDQRLGDLEVRVREVERTCDRAHGGAPTTKRG